MADNCSEVCLQRKLMFCHKVTQSESGLYAFSEDLAPVAWINCKANIEKIKSVSKPKSMMTKCPQIGIACGQS